MKMIYDKEWDKISPILLSLAKRVRPNSMSWGKLDLINFEVTMHCYCCDQILKYKLNNSTVYEIRNHGFDHVVEKNLIPFI